MLEVKEHEGTYCFSLETTNFGANIYEWICTGHPQS